MPTYVYRREDGSTFELEQRITEDALTVDPETGQAVERIITGTAGLVFKGSGFYQTDYGRSNTSTPTASSESGNGSDAGSESTSSSGDTSSDAGNSGAAASKSDTSAS